MTLEWLNQIFLMIYPVAAVSSQSLLDTCLFILFFITVFLIRKKKSKFVFETIGVEWAFIGYAGVVLLGFIVNAPSQAEWFNSLVKFSWLINIYVLIYAWQSVEIQLVKIIQGLSVLTLGPTIYSLASYLHGFDLITGRENTRITGLVNSATYHAHGNAVLFIILFGGLYFSFKKLSPVFKCIIPLSTFLLGLSILLTFTRGIWLSIFISSVIIIFFLSWKNALKFLALAGVGFFLCLNFWPKFNARVEHTSSVEANEDRISLFKVNVQMWKEYPLLGIGYGENIRRNREYWDRPEWKKPENYIVSHAHNQFLNVASTTGIFGLFFFCCFYFYFLFKNYKLVRKTNFKTTPEKYALLVICLWVQFEFALGCLTDVSFEYAKIRALILLIWALVVALDKKPDLVRENVSA